MNKAMKNLLLWGLVPAVLATARPAQAQVQYLDEGEACIVSGTPASGSGTMSYLWFRNNVPIENATEPSYIVPDYLAYGVNVEFKRRVVSSACPGSAVYTNVVTITFYPPLIVNGLRWSPANVDDYQTFADRPDMYTKFYKWNNATAFAATGTVSSGWNVAANTSSTWTINPCPAGWRLPTRAEILQLLSTGISDALTSQYMQPRGANVGGHFIGPNRATCTLPSNMYRQKNQPPPFLTI